MVIVGAIGPIYHWEEDSEGISILSTRLIATSEGKLVCKTEFVRSHCSKHGATLICKHMNKKLGGGALST